MNNFLSRKRVVSFVSVGIFAFSLLSTFVYNAQSARAQSVGGMMQTGLPPLGQEFDAPIYISSDGALTVHAGGDYVDPYFATKALLAAHASGFNIDRVGKRWIEWLLVRQRANGLFDRYTRVAPGVWQATASSDADDAMLALWIELLHTLSPNSGLPAEWRQSMRRARTRLSELRDPATGVYFISTSLRVGLLMDNCEIYGAFQNIAIHEGRFGQRVKARQTRQEAAALGSAIEAVFWRSDLNEYSISTQDVPRDTFYPYAVGQLYPILENIPTTQGQAAPGIAYSQWLYQHTEAWLDTDLDLYPWGLVALTGVAVGDDAVAVLWMGSAAPLRYSARWNVLEEAIFQGLNAQLG